MQFRQCILKAICFHCRLGIPITWVTENSGFYMLLDAMNKPF